MHQNKRDLEELVRQLNSHSAFLQQQECRFNDSVVTSQHIHQSGFLDLLNEYRLYAYRMFGGLARY